MDVIGGGVLVAAAAALWIAYLLPSWLRRRQYLETERNAVRLQQTLRILAETAETPEQVRVEATARAVVTQQRILREQEQAARLAAQAAEHLAIAERRAAQEAADAARAHAASVPAVRPGPAKARRALRRTRALCSLVLLVSLLTMVGGLVASMFGASLLIAAGGGLGIVIAIAGIARLARVRPAVTAPVAAPAPVAEAESFEPIELPEESPGAHGWTPQPLPRPLHLSRGTIAATAMASIDAAAELKRAAAVAEVARRAERLSPAMPTIVPAAATPSQPASTSPAASGRPVTASSSPYARMGIVEDPRPGFGDLDAVLRRRRQAG
ncbi:MAG TPA: hypothetical protein VFG92_01140 [Agromyces sp.]|nr:hypothetical protein [Agromyces sp.]